MNFDCKLYLFKLQIVFVQIASSACQIEKLIVQYDTAIASNTRTHLLVHRSLNLPYHFFWTFSDYFFSMGPYESVRFYYIAPEAQTVKTFRTKRADTLLATCQKSA